MSPLAEFDRRMEQAIQDFVLRILAPRWTAFDAVWETTNRICDRYEAGNPSSKRLTTDRVQPLQLRLFT